MLLAIVSVIVSTIINGLYFKVKHNKVLFPVISAVIFSVIISTALYIKTDTVSYIKYFSVLSLLHLCSTNDIICHKSENIFPILIIIIGFIAPQNIIYNLISFAVIAVIFIIIIVTSKDTIGGGDIKMICALAFFFGISATATAIIIACIAGIIYALAVKLIAKPSDLNKRFAFLPFVEVGFVSALLIQLY